MRLSREVKTVNKLKSDSTGQDSGLILEIGVGRVRFVPQGRHSATNLEMHCNPFKRDIPCRCLLGIFLVLSQKHIPISLW